MKALFSSRRAAALTLAATAVLFSLLAVNRSVARRSRAVRAAFSDGVYSAAGRYTVPSLRSQLLSSADDALGLVTLGAHTDAGAETAALRSAREALLDALDSGDVSDCARAYASLTDAASALETALDGAGLSADDAAAEADYVSGLTGAASAIASNPYNDEVKTFRETVLYAIPTAFLRPVIFCAMPEYFE